MTERETTGTSRLWSILSGIVIALLTIGVGALWDIVQKQGDQIHALEEARVEDARTFGALLQQVSNIDKSIERIVIFMERERRLEQRR